MLGLIFTYAATFFGSLIGLFNPFIGLLVYISFSIVRPASMWHWSVSPEPYSLIIAICFLIGWVFHGFGRWKLGKAWGILIPLVGFWIWAVLSSLSASNSDVAWTFVSNQGKIVLPFLVGITLIDSVDKLKKLAWVLVLSLGYVAFEMNLSYYQGFNRIAHASFAGMDNNGLALSMVIGVGLAFFLGVGAIKWWHRVLIWVTALLMAHSVMLAFSRGGMLALIISMAVSFMLLPPQKPKHLLAFFIVVLIGLRLAGPEVTDRFTSIFIDPEERDYSSQSRLELWEANWDVMKKHPILGVGPDHWPLIAPEYGWELGKEGHSMWFQTGAELGFPGVSFLLLFYFLCMIRLWPIIRGKRDVSDPWLCDAGRMVIASLAGFLVAAQFVSAEGVEVPYYVALLGAGVLVLTTKSVALPTLRKVPDLSAAASLFPR